MTPYREFTLSLPSHPYATITQRSSRRVTDHPNSDYLRQAARSLVSGVIYKLFLKTGSGEDYRKIDALNITEMFLTSDCGHIITLPFLRMRKNEKNREVMERYVENAMATLARGNVPRELEGKDTVRIYIGHSISWVGDVTLDRYALVSGHFSVAQRIWSKINKFWKRDQYVRISFALEGKPVWHTSELKELEYNEVCREIARFTQKVSAYYSTGSTSAERALKIQVSPAIDPDIVWTEYVTMGENSGDGDREVMDLAHIFTQRLNTFLCKTTKRTGTRRDHQFNIRSDRSSWHYISRYDCDTRNETTASLIEREIITLLEDADYMSNLIWSALDPPEESDNFREHNNSTFDPIYPAPSWDMFYVELGNGEGRHVFSFAIDGTQQTDERLRSMAASMVDIILENEEYELFADVPRRLHITFKPDRSLYTGTHEIFVAPKLDETYRQAAKRQISRSLILLYQEYTHVKKIGYPR